MGTFIQYLKESVSYVYTAPKHISKLIADFYLWSYLYQTYSPLQDNDNEKDLYQIVQESIPKVINALYKYTTGHRTTSRYFQEWFFYYDSQLNGGDLSYMLDEMDINKKDYIINFIRWLDNMGVSHLSVNDFRNGIKKTLDFDDNIKDERLRFDQAWKSIGICLYNVLNSDINNIKNMIFVFDRLINTMHENGNGLCDTNTEQSETTTMLAALDIQANGDLWELQKYSSIPEYVFGKYMVHYRHYKDEVDNVKYHTIDILSKYLQTINNSMIIYNGYRDKEESVSQIVMDIHMNSQYYAKKIVDTYGINKTIPSKPIKRTFTIGNTTDEYNFLYDNRAYFVIPKGPHKNKSFSINIINSSGWYNIYKLHANKSFSINKNT